MKTPSASTADQNPETSGAVPLQKSSASEKRKAQNRAAQRTYRLKRIARLKELEDLATSAGLLDGPKTGQAESRGKEEKKSSINTSNVLISPSPFDSRTITREPTAQPSTLVPGEECIYQDFDASWALLDAQTPTVTDLQPYNSKGTSNSPSIVPFMLSWETTGSKAQWSTNSSSSNSDLTDLTPLMSMETCYADPYANNLRLHAITFLLACQINAELLGLPDIMNNCDDDIISPFFNPEAPGKPQILDSALRQYRDMKRDLRPIVTQITTPHHPSADMLPFPEVRSRLIELTACDPPLIDEDEFWDDCMVQEGVVCWGSLAPQRGTAPAGGGTPWDSRSWEAKRWFLSKWSFVVGGDDSELARNSEWWRSMRGIGQGFSL